MSFLKSLIQRLLDSRTTPAQAGHASKPSSAVSVDYNPSASVDNWGPVLSNSTAVSDGYIWAAGRTTSDKGFFQINTQALQITTTGTSNPGGEILNLFTPVSKGQLFSVYGRHLEQITVRLVKTIGGGYNHLVRRALSCLRPSFNYLLKSSYRTNPNGSDIRLCRATVCNSTQQSLGMSRLLTDGSEFTRTRTLPLMSLSLREGWLWRGPQQLKRLELPAEQVALFLLQRVRDLSLLLSLGSLKFGFHQLTAPQVNFAVGGASC